MKFLKIFVFFLLGLNSLNFISSLAVARTTKWVSQTEELTEFEEWVNDGITKGERKKAKKHPIRWPNGVIPYIKNKSITFWDKIQEVIYDYNRNTNLFFREKTDADTNYLTFDNNSNQGRSSSKIGFQGGAQNVHYNADYRLAHEIGHALGFIHEHQRSDRDNYLEINTSNFDKGQADFVSSAITTKETDSVALSNYDIGSIMHYWCSAGATKATTWEKLTGTSTFNGEYITMVYKKEKSKKFDTSETLSANDIIGINKYYPDGFVSGNGKPLLTKRTKKFMKR
jgi:hypothetical protein